MHGVSDIHKQAVVDDYDKPEQCGVMGYVAPPTSVALRLYEVANFAPLNKMIAGLFSYLNNIIKILIGVSPTLIR